MVVTPADLERQLLRQGQCACRVKAGCVPVTVLLLLDKGRPVPSIADDPGLDQGTVYRYAQTYHKQDLVGSLRAEQPGYWGLLTSAQLASLCRELDQTRSFDCRAIAAWLAGTTGVRYLVSGLTDRLHRLGYAY